jgi:hypothetical protein
MATAAAGTTARITRANVPIEASVTMTVAEDFPIPTHMRNEQQKCVAKLLEAHMVILREIGVLRANRNQTSNSSDRVADNKLAPGTCWWLIIGHDKYRAKYPNSRPITLWEQLSSLGIKDETFGSWFQGESGFSGQWQSTFAKRWEGRGLRVAECSSAMFITIDNDLGGSLPDTRHLMPSPDGILDHSRKGDWEKCLILQREALKLPNMPLTVAQASAVFDSSTPDTRSRKRRRISAIAAGATARVRNSFAGATTRVRNPFAESLSVATSPAPERNAPVPIAPRVTARVRNSFAEPLPGATCPVPKQNTPAPKEKAPVPKETTLYIPPEAAVEKPPAPPSLLPPNLLPTRTVDAATRAKYPVLAKHGISLERDDFLAQVDRGAILRELWNFNNDHSIPNEIQYCNSASRRLVSIVPRKANLTEDTANFVRVTAKSGMVENILDAIVVDDKKAAAALLCHYLAKRYTEEYMKPVPMAQVILEKEAKESIRRERRESGIPFDEYQLSRWESRYKALVAYKAEHGHCNAPAREDTGVGKFVSQQRTAYKEKRLSDERITRLEDIGFTWQVGSSPSSDIRFFKAIAAKHYYMESITAREALLLSGYNEEESRETSRMGNVRDKARLFHTKTDRITKQQKEIASILTQLTREGGPMAVFGSSPFYNAFVVQRNAKAKDICPDSDMEDGDGMSSGSS